MNHPAPFVPAAVGRRFGFRSFRFSIELALALGSVVVCNGNPPERLPPVAVSGLVGVTFLTTDLVGMRRFYGQGAGFAEEPAGFGNAKFMVGAGQWIEFQTARDFHWPRRLQHLTLAAPDLANLERALSARGVPARWLDSGPRGRVLELEDPAGNLIQVIGPRIPPAAPSLAVGPFSVHLQHAGLAVDRTQAEATVAFYGGKLGWPEVFRLVDPGGRLALVKFRLPGPGRELIELIFFDPPLNQWAAGSFDHISFEVGDIDEAYRALRRGGIANQGKHRPTVNGEHLWAIDVVDPELTRMEVQVIAPTKAAIGTISTVGGQAGESRLP